jgi:hypothetical protein
LAEVSAERSKLISSLGSMPDLRGDDFQRTSAKTGNPNSDVGRQTGVSSLFNTH